MYRQSVSMMSYTNLGRTYFPHHPSLRMFFPWSGVARFGTMTFETPRQDEEWYGMIHQTFDLGPLLFQIISARWTGVDQQWSNGPIVLGIFGIVWALLKKWLRRNTLRCVQRPKRFGTVLSRLHTSPMFQYEPGDLVLELKPFFECFRSPHYPLVNIQKAIEHGHLLWICP